MWFKYMGSVSNWLHFYLLLFYGIKPQFCWSFAQPRGTGSQCFARVWIKGFIVWRKLENFQFQCVMENEWHLQQRFYQNVSCSEQATQTLKGNQQLVAQKKTWLFFVALLFDSHNDIYEIVSGIIYSFSYSISSSAISGKDAWVRSVGLSYCSKTTQ